MVRKCLDKQTCEQLQIHFTLQYHERQTRNNNYAVKIARIKTEFARKSFMFMDANVYNELPLVKLRTIRNSRNNLKNILNDTYFEIILETLNVKNCCPFFSFL